ncbi:hypothetical protein [uncultured Thiodictyon sp.]|uniref:hypothetical protein n=1 Tax=uncultured Thiodictyon sp. TaxID=1846217 RepID=UPI0025EEA5FA|nr:hypothetical protein [uncultured Thiodictyon sp.]
MDPCHPCHHCLRPTFTARLGVDLECEAAINLIAAPGQGAGRLLDDLRGLTGRGPRLVANLKRHRASLPALVTDLWSQAGLGGGAPTSLGELCDRLERDLPAAALLLHRFDVLLDNPELDPAYDDAFINALNALRNRGLSLVCVSARRLAQHVILTPGGVRTGSILDLAREDLPVLAWSEVMAEIERRHLCLDEKDRARLAAAVLDNPCPWDFLDLACRRLADGVNPTWSLRKRLKRWAQEVHRDGRRLGPGSVVRLRHRLQTWWRASGLGKLLPLARLGAWIGGFFPGGRG